MGDDFDIVVIGGGLCGLGIAYEGTFHGFRVALLESESGPCRITSANSLRIVHGGFRYLQNAAISRMRSSATALDLLLLRYPDLIKPLRSVMPLHRWGLKSPLPVTIALQLYNLLAKVPPARRGRIIPSAEIEQKIPILAGHASNGALEWCDGLLSDPGALADTISAQIVGQGGLILYDHLVKSVTIGPNAVRLETAHGAYSGRVLINAAGAGIDRIIAPGLVRPSRRWCRAWNVILRRRFDPDFGIAGEGRGRLLFAVPRDSGTAVGTWYDFTGLEELRKDIGEEALSSALADINSAYPNVSVRRDEIIKTEVGLLPLGFTKSNGEPVAQGKEEIFRFGRYFELLSTKFTTFPTTAQTILRAAAPLLKT
jgi:glycerol-3-phosphate dehydrogenase